jgi:hypothetical protein
VQLSPSHPTLHLQVDGCRQYPFCLLQPELQMADKGQIQVKLTLKELPVFWYFQRFLFEIFDDFFK